MKRKRVSTKCPKCDVQTIVDEVDEGVVRLIKCAICGDRWVLRRGEGEVEYELDSDYWDEDY